MMCTNKLARRPSWKKEQWEEKRKKREDRISKFPDELIHEILKHLDPLDAVDICMLSKSWVNIWTTLPSLNFKPMPYAYVRSLLCPQFS